MQKDFNNWNELKTQLNSRRNIPTFKQREVWWCSIGVNIGNEEDGKNKLFNRPVLVLKKFNKNIFLGIPMSTAIKENKYYYQVSLKGKTGSVLLSQIRVFETKRITHKIGSLSQDEFDLIRGKVKEMI